MNVFDFDKTVYDGDSTVDFFKYIAVRHPAVIFDLCRSLGRVVAYKRGRISKTEMKQSLYRAFARVPDMDKTVERFWDKRISRIEGWYLEVKREDDVIISASPEFLLAEACRRLGIVRLIASRVDMNTGKYDGENCYGEEKPRRFFERFSSDDIDSFYYDSYSDTPMAKLAKKAYIIKKHRPLPWNKG